MVIICDLLSRQDPKHDLSQQVTINLNKSPLDLSDLYIPEHRLSAMVL